MKNVNRKNFSSPLVTGAIAAGFLFLPGCSPKDAAPVDKSSGAKPAAPAATASADLQGDWPCWGGNNGSRNMYSPAKNLPDHFDVGKYKSGSEDVDPATTKNVKWAAKLGSQAFGNVVVAGGKVFIGTNNENPRDPHHLGDHSILLVPRRKDRRFSLATGRSQAGVRQSQRLGRPWPAFLAECRRQPRLYRHQPLRSDVPGHRRPGQRQRRPVHGRGAIFRRPGQYAQRPKSARTTPTSSGNTT